MTKGMPVRSLWKSRIYTDRDYHVHLGGAIPKELIKQWIKQGDLSENDTIMDFHTHDSFHCKLEPIMIRDALQKYRKGKGFLDAYQAPYDSLEDFLTLYRAYSRHRLVYSYACEIAQSIYPKADIRMSVPFPPEGAPDIWAQETLKKARYYQSCFGTEQQLILLFPRNHFTARKNREYWQALIQSIKDQDPERADYINPAFDFAAVPIEVSEMVEMLAFIKQEIPEAFIAYHHGETCLLPLEVEVCGAKKLLPFIDRMGHGMCLGLALQSSSEFISAIAHEVLEEMAEREIGIEVAPTGNTMINKSIEYYCSFLEKGVDLYLGTDDPGFIRTNLDKETRLLYSVLEITEGCFQL